MMWLWFAKLFIFVSIILSAILGNSLVIVAVWRNRKLRTWTNYFVVSLALADTLVALGAMSFNASQTLNDGRWMFGWLLCDIWNSLDVYFCTVSILHLCCISIDRFYAICKPLQYISTITKNTVRIMLTAIWILPVFVSFIPILTGFYAAEDLSNPDRITNDTDFETCAFEVNRTYAIVSSSISFWLPAVVMIITYYRIYREAVQQEHILYRTKVAAALLNKHLQISEIPISVQNNTSNSPGNNHTRELYSTPSEVQSMKREHKAARTLGIIMGVFILCWLPFFTWYLVTSLCGNELCPTPEWVVIMMFWIGYSNSALNPIIYAYFNKDFREAFMNVINSIFCGKCVRRENTENGPGFSSASNKMEPVAVTTSNVDA